MPVAIGHLALVVAQRALLALPARIANAFAIDVLAMLGAQHGADALTAVVASEAGITLAVSQQALAIAGAPIRAVLRHIFRYGCIESQLLHIPIVVVERDEPVPRLHIAGHLASYGKLAAASKRKLICGVCVYATYDV